MKKYLKIFTFAFAITFFASCVKNTDGLSVEYVAEIISEYGGTTTFKIFPGAIQQWELSVIYGEGSGSGWLELSQMSGSGDAIITATIAQASTMEQREVIVFVTTPDNQIVPVHIVQAGVTPYFNALPTYTNVPANEGGQFIARSIEVTSNIYWRAEIKFHSPANEVDWVYFLPDYTFTHSSSGSRTINLHISNYYPEPDEIVRRAHIWFYDTSDELLQVVDINQVVE